MILRERFVGMTAVAIVAMMTVSGLYLTLTEAGLMPAWQAAQFAKRLDDPAAAKALDFAVAAFQTPAHDRADIAEERLLLMQLAVLRAGELPDPTARVRPSITDLRDAALDVVRIKPMPGRAWCYLAAYEARLSGMSTETLHALEVCSAAIPGDTLSLDARWELILAAWPVVPQTARRGFMKDLAALSRVEHYEGRGHIERLARISARIAPNRSDLVASGLGDNPELMRFYLDALHSLTQQGQP